MRGLLAVVLMVALAACTRQVEVDSGPAPASGVALDVTNNASQAVNVYVVTGGNELFVGQVPANSTQRLPVSGVASGSSVTLRARLMDGTRTYARDNVMLTGTYSWRVP
ncbi:MAG: hypothetical protein ACREON_06025 [Gemmatimonadaceae bacterium]